MIGMRLIKIWIINSSQSFFIECDNDLILWIKETNKHRHAGHNVQIKDPYGKGDVKISSN